MAEPPDFYTVDRQYSAEHRVKDSLFIAHLAPAANRENAEKFITKKRQEYADATHNCFAYRIGKADQCEYRFDDDGEPGGSSGRPILQAMQGRELSNAVIVVTRYFGGTKLGVGGLIRAYGGAAFVCIDAAKLVPVIPEILLQLQFSYDFTGTVHHILNHQQCPILSTDYAENVVLKIKVLKAQRALLEQKLLDATRGQIKIH